MTNQTCEVSLIVKAKGTVIGRRSLSDGGPIVSYGLIYITRKDFNTLKAQLAETKAKAKLGRQTEADDQEG